MGIRQTQVHFHSQPAFRPWDAWHSVGFFFRGAVLMEQGTMGCTLILLISPGTLQEK